jgi:hypothetical protein
MVLTAVNTAVYEASNASREVRRSIVQQPACNKDNLEGGRQSDGLRLRRRIRDI